MSFEKFALGLALLVLSAAPAFATASTPAESKSGHRAAQPAPVMRPAKPIAAGRAQPIASAMPTSYVLRSAAATSAAKVGAPPALDVPALNAVLARLAASGDDRAAAAAANTQAVARSSAKAGAAVAASKPAADAPELVAKTGVVTKKGMRSLAQAGVPQPVVAQVAEAFSRDAAVHGVPPEHAAFRVVYEQVASGKARRKHPELRFASVTISGKEHRIFRYPVEHDAMAFVDSSGRGVMPLDLASPVPGAPITSPFGWRIHPILEIRKFHEGVDFGAPTGTPVRAAEDGTVEDVGLRGNYGNYVRVRHSGQLQTAYAHLDGFAPGLHSGSHVRRGEVIAYIGTTGWATGPHLYYEVIVDGEHRDPLRRDLSLPVQLAGAALRRFKQYAELLATPVRLQVNKACLLPLCKSNQDLG